MCICGGVVEVGLLSAIGLGFIAAWRWLKKRLRRKSQV